MLAAWAGHIETSAVSVDVLTLRYEVSTGVALGIALRRWDPFRGELALPGVLLGRGERLRHAAERAVVSKLGIRADAIEAMGQLATFDEPSRDPRGPTLSLAMWVAVADDTEGDARWVGLDRVPPLAFDHNRIVADCRPILAAKLWKEPDLAKALTGQRFPASRAVSLTAALSGGRPDPANLNRTLSGMPGLSPTRENIRTKPTGRPSKIWAWDRPLRPSDRDG